MANFADFYGKTVISPTKNVTKNCSKTKPDLYYCTNGDGSTYTEGSATSAHFQIGERFYPFGKNGRKRWAVAPDFDANPNRECGGGIHLVEWNPLFALRFVERYHPIFWKIEKTKHLLPLNGGKRRCRAAYRSAKPVEITEDMMFEALETGDYHLSTIVADLPNATEAVLLKCIASPYPFMRMYASENPNATEKVRQAVRDARNLFGHYPSTLSGGR